MTRTWLSMITALVLVLLSIGVFVGRRLALGSYQESPRGTGAWKVTLAAAGELLDRGSFVVTVLPPDFRHQHIFDEAFQSKELSFHLGKGRAHRHREMTWRRTSMSGTQPFRLSYSFRCVMGMRRPTAAMGRMTKEIDASPAEGSYLKPSPRIESDHKDIFRKARELVQENMAPMDQARTFFEFVSRFDNEPTVGTRTALECLRADAGDSGAKSRLLVALCRNRNIPARVVSGLILGSAQEQSVHQWAEAWVNEHWLPMCPTFQHFGTRKFPTNYLWLGSGDDDIVRGGKVKYGFFVQALDDPLAQEEGETASKAVNFWRKLSLYSLHPSEQHIVKFLLLLPLGALIVAFYRTMIGVPTFGTFSPALVGLAFLDLKALPWGLSIFVATVLVGWAIRHVLDPFRLLLAPRTAILLTLIVLFLITVIGLASYSGVAVTHYIALFPLVILTHLVERFWTVEAEDGTTASFKTLFGTLVVAVSVSLALSHEEVTRWMFRHPETLGVVMAVQFLMGRYTGYRVSELYRFQDLMREEPPSSTPGGNAP